MGMLSCSEFLCLRMYLYIHVYRVLLLLDNGNGCFLEMFGSGVTRPACTHACMRGFIEAGM